MTPNGQTSTRPHDEIWTLYVGRSEFLESSRNTYIAVYYGAIGIMAFIIGHGTYNKGDSGIFFYILAQTV